jgi:hypothetical protein
MEKEHPPLYQIDPDLFAKRIADQVLNLLSDEHIAYLVKKTNDTVTRRHMIAERLAELGIPKSAVMANEGALAEKVFDQVVKSWKLQPKPETEGIEK